MDKPILTPDTYYDDNYYMSTSRFKNYIDCEAKALAIDNGAWEEEKTPIQLVVGNYVHSYFESPEEHQKFLEAYYSYIYKEPTKADVVNALEEAGIPYDKKLKVDDLRAFARANNIFVTGEKKSDFINADKVIQALKDEPVFQDYYEGKEGDWVEKEMILTGELEGLPFKGKVDSINLTQQYFVDLKTMRSIAQETWSPTLHQRVPQMVYNVYEYKYHLQMFIYQKLLEQMDCPFFTPYMVAVSKEEIPDKEVIVFDDEILEIGEAVFYAHVNRVKEVVSGLVPPNHCGECDYCKTIKHLEYPALTLAQYVEGESKRKLDKIARF